MKLENLILIIICFISLKTDISYSQQDNTLKKIIINKDTIEIGKYYSFYISTKEAFLGKLTAVDENTLLIYYDGKLNTINKMDIVSIENAKTILYDLSVTRKKIGQERAYWLFGASYLTTKDADFSNGFNFYANSLVTFNDYFGLRADFDFNHIPRNDKSYSYKNYNGSQDYYEQTGGTINSFFVRFNLSFGFIDPESYINVYISPGIGIGGYYNTTITSKQTYTYPTPRVYSYSSNDTKLNPSVIVSAGLGISVKLNHKLRIYSEYQPNTWTGDSKTFNNLKLGIILVGR